MLTTVEVALRKPRSADEYRQTLEDCRGVARQMRHLVERLLALARLDAGSFALAAHGTANETGGRIAGVLYRGLGR